MFLFVNQSYLVKGTKLRYIYVRGFILQLKIASASVVNFCVSQKEILIGIEGSLQCRRILDARVHIFVLGRHLGFGNRGGLRRGNISLRSRR